MKILVIGARGMLGSDLVPLLQIKYDVFEADTHNCNILDQEQLRDVVASYRPEVIIHTAAYTNVDQAESNPDIASQVNETGTKHVAAAASAYHAKLVYISTDYVFNGTHSTPYTEDETTHPLGVYGRTKLGGERHIQEIFHRTAYPSEYLIVRTAWLYGRHGKNFVSAILQRAQQRLPLRVVHDQTGSPTYTKDLARGIISLLEHHGSGIVHVTNSGSCTWYEFAKSILEYARLSDVSIEPITTEQLQRPALRPRFSVLDTSKFTTLTGQHMRHWKEGLQEYFEELGQNM